MAPEIFRDLPRMRGRPVRCTTLESEPGAALHDRDRRRLEHAVGGAVFRAWAHPHALDRGAPTRRPVPDRSTSRLRAPSRSSHRIRSRLRLPSTRRAKKGDSLEPRAMAIRRLRRLAETTRRTICPRPHPDTDRPVDDHRRLHSVAGGARTDRSKRSSALGGSLGVSARSRILRETAAGLTDGSRR